MTKQYISFCYFPCLLLISQKQITAIDDIEVAICQLESTGWDLEVRKLKYNKMFTDKCSIKFFRLQFIWPWKAAHTLTM